MKLFRTLPALLAFSLFYLSSCKKEAGSNDPDGNNGGNNNNNASCNNTVMKLKKWQALFNPDHYNELEWNSNGSIKMIKMNVPLSEYRSATYLYENDRIKEAVLRTSYNNEIYDTVIFHYNGAGKVDSMYLKNDNYFNIKLTYTGGKITKYTRYANTVPMIYWDIETDAKDNITKAVEWWDLGSGFEKQSTMTFTRDDRKNPFAGLAPYMFYLDDDYNIFWYWGPNNYTNQNYLDHTGSGINLNTGFKFKYNDNCYPATSQNTIEGSILFTDDDFQFTYY